jgi:hypothetical protein
MNRNFVHMRKFVNIWYIWDILFKLPELAHIYSRQLKRVSNCQTVNAEWEELESGGSSCNRYVLRLARKSKYSQHTVHQVNKGEKGRGAALTTQNAIYDLSDWESQVSGLTNEFQCSRLRSYLKKIRKKRHNDSHFLKIFYFQIPKYLLQNSSTSHCKKRRPNTTVR